MNKRFIFFVSLCLFCAQYFAQLENSRWYFGFRCDLDFTQSPVFSHNDGKLHAAEGSASIADANGNLLFYTSGDTVWNKIHTPMANGTGLFGGGSSTQAAIIIPHPVLSSQYYIFTLAGASSTNGFCYSIVDMSLASGHGSVIAKNVPLYSDTCAEGFTATRHCNGKDFWIVIHPWYSSDFRAYLLDQTGVSQQPVISTIGSFHKFPDIGVQGAIKISPNGRKLCKAVQGNGNLPDRYELFDFDNMTGQISNLVTLDNIGYNIYSCEFSPDGTKLYGEHTTSYINDTLYQWDLCSGSEVSIKTSKHLISSNFNHRNMQLAPDGKIYLFMYTALTRGLSTINSPNLAGAACSFSIGTPSVAPGIPMGLPSFMNYNFKDPLPGISYSVQLQSCRQLTFNAQPFPGLQCNPGLNDNRSVLWNFGDVASGAANTSTLITPEHLFSSAGSYTVDLIIFSSCSTDTIRKVITINGPEPVLNINGNLNICKGETATITVTGANTYTWSGGSQQPVNTYSPVQTTTYTVSGSSSLSACQSSTLFTIQVDQCLDLKRHDYRSTFTLFPNPVVGGNILNVRTSLGGQVSIYDELGICLVETRIEAGATTLDISVLSRGVYLVQFSAQGYLLNRKLIKF